MSTMGQTQAPPNPLLVKILQALAAGISIEAAVGQYLQEQSAVYNLTPTELVAATGVALASERAALFIDAAEAAAITEKATPGPTTQPLSPPTT